MSVFPCTTLPGISSHHPFYVPSADLGSTSQAILSLASLPFTLLSLASVGAMAKAHLFPQHDPELHKAS